VPEVTLRLRKGLHQETTSGTRVRPFPWILRRF
jgi:hypothetical protein